MDEHEIRALIGTVKDGRTSRRDFVRRMAAFGLAAPTAGMMLSHAGVAWRNPRSTPTSRRRPAAAGRSRSCSGRP